MKTSYLQYMAMVDFMEVNGDLSKPSGGPRGWHFLQLKWKELTSKLNSDGTGDARSEEKWRKVWSDYKNNIKKKQAEILRAASGTGGGPALPLSMNEQENRVMQIFGVQAATGMMVEEAGFQRDVVPETQYPETAPVQDSEGLFIQGKSFEIKFTAALKQINRLIQIFICSDRSAPREYVDETRNRNGRAHIYRVLARTSRFLMN